MKKSQAYIALAILLFITAGSFAQSDDHTRIDKLLQSSEISLENESIEGALTSALNALDLSKQLNYVYGITMSEILIARSYKRKKDFSRSLEYYLRAQKEFEQERSLDGLSNVQIEIGLLFRDWGVHERALENFERVYKQEEQIENSSARLLYLAELIAKSHHELKEYEKALFYFEKTIVAYIKANDKKKLRNVLTEVSEIYQKTMRYQDAIDYELKILELSNEFGDSLRAVTSLNNIGFYSDYLGMDDQAEDYFLRSLQLNRSLMEKNRLHKGDLDIILINLAMINKHSKKYKTALKYLYEALQIRVGARDFKGTAEIYNELAYIYFRKSDFDNAVNYASASILISDKANTPEVKVISYQILSDVNSLNGSSAEALEFYKLYVATKNEVFEAQDRRQQELQKNNLLVEKKERQLKLAMIDQQIKDLALKESQLEMRRTEADIKFLRQDKELQDIKLKHQQSEKEKAEQALALTQNLYLNERNERSLADYQKNDSIQTLVIKQNELEESKRQREIELLQKAQAIQKLELQRANDLIYLFVGGIVLFVTVIFFVLRSNRARRIANFRLKNQNFEIQKQKDEIGNQKDKLQQAFETLKTAQAQLVQSEKMASLGLLTAGVAHEINNPINFVHAGVDGLTESLSSLILVLDKYNEMNDESSLENARQILEEVKALKKQLYFEETQEGLFEVVGAIREGASRTAEIVNGLRNFSRLDETELKMADVHDGINNTLLLLNNELRKQKIKLVTEYDPNLPIIQCYAGQLNQVFMNILSNAIQACTSAGVISISTKSMDSGVQISIADNGEGMKEEVKKKIFEPFFTTKEKQKGTGLGMSISFGIIKKHGGSIDVISVPNEGTTISIFIPQSPNETVTEKPKHRERVPALFH